MVFGVEDGGLYAVYAAATLFTLADMIQLTSR
jgi:hypothetical protein